MTAVKVCSHFEVILSADVSRAVCQGDYVTEGRFPLMSGVLQ